MAHERARVFIGNDASGKPKYSQISGRNQDERNDNIVLKHIETGRIWELMNMEELSRYLPRPPEPPKHPFSEYARACIGDTSRAVWRQIRGCASPIPSAATNAFSATSP